MKIQEIINQMGLRSTGYAVIEEENKAIFHVSHVRGDEVYFVEGSKISINSDIEFTLDLYKESDPVICAIERLDNCRIFGAEMYKALTAMKEAEQITSNDIIFFIDYVKGPCNLMCHGFIEEAKQVWDALEPSGKIFTEQFKTNVATQMQQLIDA